MVLSSDLCSLRSGRSTAAESGCAEHVGRPAALGAEGSHTTLKGAALPHPCGGVTTSGSRSPASQRGGGPACRQLHSYWPWLVVWCLSFPLVCLSVCLSLSFCVCLSLCVSLSLSLSVHQSVCLSVSLSLSVCLSVCLSLSLSLSFCLSLS